MKDNKPKILKIEKQEVEHIELSEKQLELKQKFLEIDNKAKELEEVLDSIIEDDPLTFNDEVVSNIIGLAALTATVNVIGKYFNIENLNLNDLL